MYICMLEDVYVCTTIYYREITRFLFHYMRLQRINNDQFL